jgi:hypothetical protein
MSALLGKGHERPSGNAVFQVQGYSTVAAGATLLPFVLLMFVLWRWAAGLVDRLGAKLPLSFMRGAASSRVLLQSIHEISPQFDLFSATQRSVASHRS